MPSAQTTTSSPQRPSPAIVSREAVAGVDIQHPWPPLLFVAAKLRPDLIASASPHHRAAPRPPSLSLYRRRKTQAVISADNKKKRTNKRCARDENRSEMSRRGGMKRKLQVEERIMEEESGERRFRKGRREKHLPMPSTPHRRPRRRFTTASKHHPRAPAPRNPRRR